VAGQAFSLSGLLPRTAGLENRLRARTLAFAGNFLSDRRLGTNTIFGEFLEETAELAL